MKTRFLIALALCAALTACGGDDDGGGTPAASPIGGTGGSNPFATTQGGTTTQLPSETDQPQNTQPETPQTQTPQTQTPPTQAPQTQTPQTQTPQTQTPQTQTPQTTGNNNQGVEDQLLNQGSAQAPGSAWLCLGGELDLVFGFYGQGNGIVGLYDDSDQSVRYSQAAYGIDTAGNVQFSLDNDGENLVILISTPTFSSGTQFSSSIVIGPNSPYTTDCGLATFSGDSSTPPGTDGSDQPPPSSDGGDLESALLNSGTQEAPQDGWLCRDDSLLFGFFAGGNGLVGNVENGSSSSGPSTYRIASGDVIISTQNQEIILDNPTFSDQDSFSTNLVIGDQAQGMNCRRVNLSAAKQSAGNEGYVSIEEMAKSDASMISSDALKSRSHMSF